MLTTLFYHFQPQSSRRFPLKYFSCLFYILKRQDAAIRSLFYTYFSKLFNISGKKQIITTIETFKIDCNLI